MGPKLLFCVGFAALSVALHRLISEVSDLEACNEHMRTFAEKLYNDREPLETRVANAEQHAANLVVATRKRSDRILELERRLVMLGDVIVPADFSQGEPAPL